MTTAPIIAELETTLQTKWDLETAAIYADALIALGDPRGELIALDLHIAQHGETAELARTRTDAVFAWIGRVSPIASKNIRFGLVESHTFYTDEYFFKEISLPAMQYLRSAEIHAHQRVVEVLERFASTPLPWLQGLAVNGDGGPVPRAIVDAFVTATPHLIELSLEGVQIMQTPAHPNVQTLRLLDCDALVEGGAEMPRVTELDLAFGQGFGRRHEAHEWPAFAPHVNLRLFPALERLDLSHSKYAYNTDSLFPFVRALDGFERVRQLRIPALRNDDDVRAALELLARYPQLEITVASMYQCMMPSGAHHPRLRVPTPRPWLPYDMVGDNYAVEFHAGRGRHDIVMRDCVLLLENQFDNMAPEARAAWTAFWELIRRAGWENRHYQPSIGRASFALSFDAATLECALAAVDDKGYREDVEWLRRNRLPPGATIDIGPGYCGW